MSCSSTLRVPSLPPPHRHLPPPPTPTAPSPLLCSLLTSAPPLRSRSDSDSCFLHFSLLQTLPTILPPHPRGLRLPPSTESCSSRLFPEARSILLGICYLIAYYKPALLITVVYCLSSQHWSALLSSCPLSLAQCWVHSRASRSDSME